MKKIKLFIVAAAVLILHSAFVINYCSAQAPTITSFAPDSGSVGTLVTITGTDLSTPTAFTIGGVTAITVSQSSTTLVGMVMPGATTGTVEVTTASGTATSTSNFTITPTPYPSLQQGSKLVGTESIGQSRQGNVVSVSADGNTAIVGAYTDNSNTGAVWIYTRTDGVWTQQGSKLVGTGAIGGAMQGCSVSVSADGNTAIVGGMSDAYSIGAAWVFTRTAGVWSQQGSKLVGIGNVGAPMQGCAVSISADGNTAIVGGFNETSSGAAWIYTRSGGVWTQQGSKLVGTGGTSGLVRQGISVCISADGNTAMVGGDYDNSKQGAVWVYTRTAGVWSQQGSKLVGTGNTGAAYQGISVSLSADGNTAMVGGYYDNTLQGAAWVYSRTAGVWSQQGSKLVGTDHFGAAQQGYSVGLSADGNTAIVGGGWDNGMNGAAWVYTRTAGVWTQKGSKLVGTGNILTPEQGTGVSISADGKTALVGGYRDNSYIGATWVYKECIAPKINSQETATQTQCLNGTFTPITVTAIGDLLTYQWFSNTTAINSGGTTLGSPNGAQTASYTPQATTAGTKYYYCIVTGVCGTQTTAVSGAFITNNPTITSFTPSSGSVGTLVTITGTDLTNITSITIG